MKLNGDGGGPWSTCERGMHQFRWAVLQHLNQKTYPHPEVVQHVFIPVDTFGVSFEDVLIFFEQLWGTRIDETTVPHQGFCPGQEVYLTLNKWKRAEYDFFGRFAIDLRIERGGCSADEFTDLCDNIRAFVQREVSFRCPRLRLM